MKTIKFKNEKKLFARCVNFNEISMFGKAKVSNLSEGEFCVVFYTSNPDIVDYFWGKRKENLDSQNFWVVNLKNERICDLAVRYLEEFLEGHTTMLDFTEKTLQKLDKYAGTEPIQDFLKMETVKKVKTSPPVIF